METCKFCGKNCPEDKQKDCELLKPVAINIFNEIIKGLTESDLLNDHGKYVLKFANTHGLSIAEAHAHPMVKAHLVAFNALEDERRNKKSYLSPLA